MLVKPSTTFINKDTDPQLVLRTEGIGQAMTNNPKYATPDPTLPVLAEARTEFAEAVAAAQQGGREATANKNAKRAVLEALLRRLAIYVQGACGGDLTVLISSGFPIQKPERQPVGVLPPPSNLTVTFGPRTGELHMTATASPGAAIFNWRVSRADAPTVIVQTLQTPGGRGTVANLTPGVVYNVEANVVGAAGPSSWTEAVAHMVV